MTEVRVPDIGDFTDVPVIELHVAPGDSVAAEDPLVTLESDKATMDIPAPAAGTVTQLRVAIGDRVSEGSVLLTLDTATGDAERLYERLGYARAGSIPDYAMNPDRSLTATTFYYKRLSHSA